MKRTFLVLFTSVTVGLAGDAQTSPGQPTLPEIQTKHRDSISNGQVIASIDTVYRGNDRILDTVKYKVARGDYGVGGGFRIYRVGGKPVLLEEDYKGDGNVTVRVLARSDDPEAFEAFKRGADRTVEPVTSAELAKLRSENRQMLEFGEGFAQWVSNSLKTNSPEKVMSDVKKVGDALKKVQENGEGQKVQEK